MDPNTRALFQGSAGAGERIYVEDVFSTWIYNGNDSGQSIVNGINLSGEGGLVWVKSRNQNSANILVDTVRGATNQLVSNINAAESVAVSGLTAFNTNGFSVGSNGNYNSASAIYASWTFRKSQKFFDVVSYTGTGVTRTVSHGLQSTPGLIIVKQRNSASNWYVYHRSLANTEVLILSSPTAKATNTTIWNSTTPTPSEFSLDATSVVNSAGNTFIAYLFAHDPNNITSCDSYTGTGAVPLEVTLGWEPQWVLIKRVDDVGGWILIDNIRNSSLFLSDSLSEGNTGIMFTSTGFTVLATSTNYNATGGTYAYVAIRRGPMRTPTDATKVFQPVVYSATNTDNRLVSTGILTDMALVRQRNSTAVAGMVIGDRLRGQPYQFTASNSAEVDDPDAFSKQLVTSEWGTAWSSMTGFWIGNDPTTSMNNSGVANNQVAHAFRRAPGFFDIVNYTGTGVARTVNHNLGVVPELMIIKSRDSSAYDWVVYSSSTGTDKYLTVGSQSSAVTDLTVWNNTAPTSLVFTVGTASGTNANTTLYSGYLFASCPGVSKVGSYTGTGTTLNIDCGFASGARYVLIKRTDSSGGSWFVWDTARGITSGNDPYLLFNSTNAEVTGTDYIDPLSAGFQISSTAPITINESGGSFIYLAIA
jgi:hypothetical protein